MRKKIRLSFLCLMYTALCIFSVNADEYQDILATWANLFESFDASGNTGLTTFPILELSPGGERSNLGNAYTAVAQDVSYFEANPAASAILERSELAFFHRNLISDVNMDSVIYTNRNNNLGYGFAGKFIHFEFTSIDSQGNQLASATPSEILLAANVSYNFFDNYYSSGLAAGINVKMAHRNIPYSLYNLEYIDLGQYSQNLFGVMADIGLLSRFNFAKYYSARDKNFSLGLTVKNLGPPVKGDALPTEGSFGIAYRPLRFLMFTGDLNYMMNLVDISKSEGFGFASGLDVRFVNFFSLQSGFELRGGNPRFSLGADIDLRPVSFQVNYTLDLTTSSSQVDNFSVTAKFDFGDRGRANIQAQVDELYIQALIALSNGDYETVIELCNRIIDPETGLDPSFNPAEETLELAMASLEVNQDFDNFALQETEDDDETTQDSDEN